MTCSAQLLSCIDYLKSQAFDDEDIHMSRGTNYHYYVEGKDEKKLLDVMKMDLRCIESGKVDVFNVIQNRFTVAQIRPLKLNTTVILVYDTDVEKIDILRQNIDFLQHQKAIKEVLCIPQVKNLEDELKRACQLKSIETLTRSSTTKDYKRDLISCSNLGARLIQCNFDVSNFWSHIPVNDFKIWGNDANKIKIP